MLDIKLIREDLENVIKGLNKRGGDYSSALRQIVEVDDKRKEAISKFENSRSEQMKISKEIGSKGGNISAEEKEKLASLSKDVKSLEVEAEKIKAELEELMLELPNLPDEDLLAGGKENNKAVKTYFEVPKKDFPLKPHYEIAEKLKLVDHERGVKMAGTGNWAYRNNGALLEWALLNYFVSTHLADGYEFILPPHILNYASGVGAGQFPKFADDVYLISNNTNGENDKQFLLPTSETALVNLYRDEVLDASMLPAKIFAYSPCYRREAGSARAEERGTVRGHQFNKIEMFQFTTPEQSPAAFEELVGKASKLVEGLGLHFNVVKLAAGDVSAGMRRTYDIEVFIPSMGYKEVSSVSNAGCFQARRANIRYREGKGDKPKFVHTLNGSGLATSRLVPAILEQYQNADGSVTVPEVLRKWLGKDKLTMVD